MPSFGEKLKAEREKRSITLEQISLSTKIGTRMLQALEEDKFSQLPGGIFNKGFVRAYARHLGMDEDQAVSDYLEAAGENAPSRMGSDPDGGLGKLAPGLEPGPQSPSPEKSRELPWGLFAVALLAVALTLSFWTRHKRGAAPAAPSVEASQSAAERTTEDKPAAPTPTDTASNSKSKMPEKADSSHEIEARLASPNSASAGHGASIEKPSQGQEPAPPATSSRSAATNPEEFTILIQAREDSWIAITADGKSLAAFMASAGTQHVVHGRQLVMIKTGNIGGVDFLFNGKKLAPQGETGQVKTLTFGPQGLQSNPPSADTP